MFSDPIASSSIPDIIATMLTVTKTMAMRSRPWRQEKRGLPAAMDG